MGCSKNHAIVKSIKNQSLIADKCFVAESFLARLRGLIGRKELAPGEAMLLPGCNDIHMWFMSIPIDVVFLKRQPDGRSVVRSVRENLRPWRFLPARDGSADDTLELPAGSVSRLGIRPGDELSCTS
jgi:uncharacterized membrane protein (UPF0127 family)